MKSLQFICLASKRSHTSTHCCGSSLHIRLSQCKSDIKTLSSIWCNSVDTFQTHLTFYFPLHCWHIQSKSHLEGIQCQCKSHSPWTILSQMNMSDDDVHIPPLTPNMFYSWNPLLRHPQDMSSSLPHLLDINLLTGHLSLMRFWCLFAS